MHASGDQPSGDEYRLARARQIHVDTGLVTARISLPDGGRNGAISCERS